MLELASGQPTTETIPDAFAANQEVHRNAQHRKNKTKQTRKHLQNYSFSRSNLIKGIEVFLVMVLKKKGTRWLGQKKFCLSFCFYLEQYLCVDFVH